MEENTIKPGFNLYVALFNAYGAGFTSLGTIEAALEGNLERMLVLGGLTAIQGISGIANYICAKNKKLDYNANRE
ncbi:hypothetical protein J4417_03290 [Candidatus Woesearchaeota archaeon]|nr:hypothetical protein [Candidatus Woesearchaeota archaeon]